MLNDGDQFFGVFFDSSSHWVYTHPTCNWLKEPLEMTSSQLNLRIDIVSDVVCPWCIIGYKQLQRALHSLSGEIVADIHWQPFELNPQMPATGQELREHIAQKYGPAAAESSAARDRLTELGDSLGFQFDYFEGMRMVNTFQAHQLLHWAAEEGLQTPLKLALFSAFFSEREDVSDPQVLAACADQVGLSPELATAVLEDRRYAAAVREAQQTWMERDVHAVPAFFINRQFMIPGAQESETFVRVLRKISDKLTAA